ncbi:PREDICTED: S-formylglutathione hydrolase-like, partial [Priapulus caudatus]|uniref:S-formylglutathione hydrolase n=1 Tax=Priapulus caudatus TaxID=37621 RepID=A0ABM1F7P0_PRICU
DLKAMQQTESVKEFGGYLKRYIHYSQTCHCEMTFSVYLPPQAEATKVPALYWLSGLTCTDDNARVKAGAQRYAAEHGIAIVFPDTSPRGDDIADEPEHYDMGQGAGFEAGAKVTDILIDQGTADEFYDEQQLLPENFQKACNEAGQKVTIRMQEGYDHSYHFIAS